MDCLSRGAKERNRQRQKVCMRERLAVESGTASMSTDRPAAMAIGEARGSRVGVGTRRQGEASCSVCHWSLGRPVEFSGKRTKSGLCE